MSLAVEAPPSCECGCGRRPTIARKTDRRDGRVKGMPNRFVTGHHIRGRSNAQRIEDSIARDPSTGCWLWTGLLDRQGYGQFKWHDDAAPGASAPRGTWRPRLAHRAAYELFTDPIPPGLVLDHLCRVRRCVNPAHLEPVSDLENRRRGLRPPHDEGCDGSGSVPCRSCDRTAGT